MITKTNGNLTALLPVEKSFYQGITTLTRGHCMDFWKINATFLTGSLNELANMAFSREWITPLFAQQIC